MEINIPELKKKIIYRANYRGTKEMDILLSSFVNDIIDDLDGNDLKELLQFLELVDDTLYKIKQKILKPKEHKNKYIFKKFKEFKI